MMWDSEAMRAEYEGKGGSCGSGSAKDCGPVSGDRCVSYDHCLTSHTEGSEENAES